MWLKTWFQERAAIALELLHRAGDDDLRRHRRAASPQFTGLPIVAAGDVLMHVRSRKPLQDTLTATRLAQAGRRMRPRARAQRRAAPALAPAPGRALPARVARAARWCSPAAAASRSTSCATSTRRRSCRAGETPASAGCASSTDAGVPQALSATACRDGVPRSRSRDELALIAAAEVRAVLPHRRRHRRAGRATQGILCQGRGSAANSLVCYCLQRHRGRPAPRDAAVRPLHQRRAQRAARHRHRLRAPAPRRGHPVHLRQVRPPPRRAHRRRHQLPAALGAARRRPRARHRPAAHRRGREEPALVRRPRHRPRAAARERLRSRGAGRAGCGSSSRRS